MQPQITMETNLGKALHEIAGRCENIVEIGTGCGLGSTLCIIEGMKKGTKFVTIESNRDAFNEARTNLNNFIPYLVVVVCGVAGKSIKPYHHPVGGKQHEEMWGSERIAIEERSPLYFRDPIDLLFLDGGEFTTDGDFLALWRLARIIALDDTNPEKSVKNHYARTQLLQAGWKVLHDHIDDRNGWAIFERP